MKNNVLNFVFAVAVATLVIGLLTVTKYTRPYDETKAYTYLQFKMDIANDRVVKVELNRQMFGEFFNATVFIKKKIDSKYKSLSDYEVKRIEIDRFVATNILKNSSVDVEYSNFIVYIWLLVFLLAYAWIFKYSSRSNQETKEPVATLSKKGSNQITFDDIVGLNEIKDEFLLIRDKIVNPQKYKDLGSKVRKGLVLEGPPGVGKTKLARAMASTFENSEFFCATGSDFVNKYVGTGANNMSNLFNQARSHVAKTGGYSVIFIDEIDGLGSRENPQENSEYVNTINKLLEELDGIDQEKNKNIIVIAATNYIHKIDPALLRHGRLDKSIVVPLPTKADRIQIINYYLKNKVHAISQEEIMSLASRCTGLSGADLEGIVEKACDKAVNHKQSERLNLGHLDESFNEFIIGKKRSDLFLTKESKKRTAFHEAGHAIISLLYPKLGKLKAVSIIPTNKTLGLTFLEPTEGEDLSFKDLEDRIKMLLAGKACEEIFLEDSSVGSSNDLKEATRIAKNIVNHGGYNHDNLSYVEIDSDKRVDIINEILKRNYDKVKKDLIKYRETILRMVSQLEDEEEIYDNKLDSYRQEVFNA